ncbi:MAG: trigger factor, partial [Bacteroidetes bacterium]
METTIKQLNEVEYELDITAPAADLAPDLDKALRAQRARTTMKGFRPGKVPMSLVRKMYGDAIAYGVAEEAVQRAYEDTIAGNEAYDVFGQPQLMHLDFGLDRDLHARIRFGVRPTFELADLSGTEIYRLVREVTDEEVDQQIEELRRDRADLLPVDEPAGEDDLVVVDMQRLEGGMPIIGEKEENVSFFLNEERVFEELRQALKGKKAGDTVRVTLPDEDEEEGVLERPDKSTGARVYEVTVKEVKRLDLPEVDEAFVREVSRDRLQTEEELREAIRKEMQDAWAKQSRELLESQIIEQLLALHPFPIPEAAIEFFLDAFVRDVMQRNDNQLPEGFDERAFRAANRGEAENQARWMLIRDKVVEQEGLAVTDADYDAFFEEMVGDNGSITPAQMRQFYQSMPELMDQVEQRLLSRKV